jgi:hypothetical protein
VVKRLKVTFHKFALISERNTIFAPTDAFVFGCFPTKAKVNLIRNAFSRKVKAVVKKLNVN